MVYNDKKLKFANQPAIVGAVLSDGNVEIAGALNVTHDTGYFRGPPPGFNGPETIRILLDSAKKPLN